MKYNERRGLLVNKAELVGVIAEKTGMKKKDAGKVVNAVFESIAESLGNCEKVQVIGFGTFDVRARQAREGRNPATGDVIQIPATKAPVFKAGKALKNSVK